MQSIVLTKESGIPPFLERLLPKRLGEEIAKTLATGLVPEEIRLRRERCASLVADMLIEENKYALIHCHSPIGGVISRIANRISSLYRKKIRTGKCFFESKIWTLLMTVAIMPCGALTR